MANILITIGRHVCTVNVSTSLPIWSWLFNYFAKRSTDCSVRIGQMIADTSKMPVSKDCVAILTTGFGALTTMTHGRSLWRIVTMVYTLWECRGSLATATLVKKHQLHRRWRCVRCVPPCCLVLGALPTGLSPLSAPACPRRFWLYDKVCTLFLLGNRVGLRSAFARLTNLCTIGTLFGHACDPMETERMSGGLWSTQS